MQLESNPNHEGTAGQSAACAASQARTLWPLAASD